jgi:hypothetical protein
VIGYRNCVAEMSLFPPTTIERLREFAKLNLCDECYPKYLGLIEPQVKQLALDQFYYWRTAESIVTQMVMKEKGAYKTNTIVISANEKPGDWESLVDIRKFRQVSSMKFWEKIEFLRGEKILSESCYQVLKLASNVRNNIHLDPMVFAMTEKDLELFRYAHQIAYQIQFARNTDWFIDDVKQQMILQADKTAGRVMQEFGSKNADSKLARTD